MAREEGETSGVGEARAEGLVMEEERDEESLALDALRSAEAEAEAVLCMTKFT